MRKIFAALTLMGLMALIIQPAFAQSPSLTGSWQLALVPNNPPTTPAPIVVGLANFTSDGGAVATAAGILVGPSGGATGTPLNPAFGNWNLGGPANGGCAMEFVSLIANSDGSLSATRTFTAFVTVSGNTFSGSYSFTVVNADNGLVADGSGTISGTLIPHFLPPTTS